MPSNPTLQLEGCVTAKCHCQYAETVAKFREHILIRKDPRVLGNSINYIVSVLRATILAVPNHNMPVKWY